MKLAEVQAPEKFKECKKRLAQIRQKYNLEMIPQVVVLDKNQDVIVADGANDLLKLHPEVCR